MTRAQGKHREFSLNQSVATLLLCDYIIHRKRSRLKKTCKHVWMFSIHWRKSAQIMALFTIVLFFMMAIPGGM